MFDKNKLNNRAKYERWLLRESDKDVSRSDGMEHEAECNHVGGCLHFSHTRGKQSQQQQQFQLLSWPDGHFTATGTPMSAVHQQNL